MAEIVDARGLSCPAPILRARAALKKLSAGEEIVVLATDPGSVADIPAFCRTTGDELVEQSQTPEGFRFLIRRSA